ncbi:hypothetical protein PS2_035198 [Malus domestica]
MGGDGGVTGEQEEDSSLSEDSSQLSSQLLRNGVSMNMEDDAVDEQTGPGFRKFCGVGSQISSASLDFEADQRMENVYRKILQSYDDLRIRSKDLEEAKSKILSYTPGAWIDRVGAVKPRDYDVPNTTTLLLVGPKGSGKSSLVNRISKVFEDDKFASERAQVSYNSSLGDGTFFLHEYMMPRCSSSFCLYDTRSLSDNSPENIKILKHWMEHGVRHGELVVRDSDSPSLRNTMMYKDRDDGYLSSEIKNVNFVIFVVNGLSVLKSMESNEDAETQYTEMIASAFKSRYLAFKDDKPLLVVTHGDLLSLDERARVRVHLGELLGIPPTTQIFDIPESSDAVTQLTIVDMIRYSLEHAEKNLPRKRKVETLSLLSCMLLLIFLSIAITIMYAPANILQHGYCPSPQAHIQHCQVPSPQAHIHNNPSPPSPPSSTSLQEHIQHDPSAEEHIDNSPLPRVELRNSKTKLQNIRIDWSKIRHLWLDDRIEWSKIRHLWLDE